MDLIPDDYEGGVAIWGASHPAASKRRSDPAPIVQIRSNCGLHVHARRAGEERKSIDKSFDSLDVVRADERRTLTYEQVWSYRAAHDAGIPQETKRCRECGDSTAFDDLLSQRVRRKCRKCSGMLDGDPIAFANPVVSLQAEFALGTTRSCVLAPGRIEIAPDTFPGGFDIWGTSPAVLWTASRPEESGAHVHGYDSDGRSRLVDQTFGVLVVNGQTISNEALRLWQDQTGFNGVLRPFLRTVRCPRCHRALLDKGWKAFIPHREFQCRCGFLFFESHATISNPICDWACSL